MSVSPCLDIFNVSTAKIESNSLSIPTQIRGKTENKIVETLALIDNGAGGVFIDQNYARNSGLDIQQLEKLLKVCNIDGTSNKQGTIKYFLRTIEHYSKRTTGKNQIMDDPIRKTKDHPWFSLVEQTQPRNQLANRRT